jgi:hypothetical protein
MKSHRDSSFQDRLDRAAKAKEMALEQLRSRPPIDAKLLAERKATSVKRETDQAERAAAEKAVARAATETAAAEASAKSAEPPPLTEAERKAERDARYAARKSRK